MAFIPIDAKADVQGSKKGKLTPAQHAQLNAWCLASKTGILDFPQDHRIKGRCEAENTVYTATNHEAVVVFHQGYIVICGRLVECEEGTEVVITTPASPTGSVEGKIILRYSLANAKETEFVVTTKTDDLIQQDLNDNPLTGIYEFELYSYTATLTSVTLTRKGNYVPDIGGKLNQFINALTGTGVIGNGKPPLQGYDKSKGTIEERLTSLGFKKGYLWMNNTSNGDYVVVGWIAQLGKVVYGTIYGEHFDDTTPGGDDNPQFYITSRNSGPAPTKNELNFPGPLSTLHIELHQYSDQGSAIIRFSKDNNGYLVVKEVWDTEYQWVTGSAYTTASNWCFGYSFDEKFN